MRIVVTGVQGFIGSHLAAYCLREGHSVIGIDRVPSSLGEDRIADCRKSPYFQIHYCDLSKTISGITERADIVFNLAASTFVDHSIKDPRHFINNNIISASNLIEDARINKVPRFVQISTDEVYGPKIEGRYTEGSPLNPSNPYAASKAACDVIANAYRTTYSFPCVIVRLSNVCGPWQHPQKVIPTFVRSAIANTPLPVFGDGTHRRCWIAVEDVCVALWKITTNLDCTSIYHVAGDDEITNLDLAYRILDILEKPRGLLQFIPDRDARPGHDRRYALCTKRTKELGWEPMLRFEQYLPHLVSWFLKHDWWLER